MIHGSPLFVNKLSISSAKVLGKKKGPAEKFSAGPGVLLWGMAYFA
jgi:hypothetical protein